MGAPAPQLFGTWASGFLTFHGTHPIVEWDGPSCPPVGMEIPNSPLGQLVFPRLAGSTFWNAMQGDCGGGLAQYGTKNTENDTWGVEAWFGIPRPDADPVEQPLPGWILTVRPDLPPAPDPEPDPELELTDQTEPQGDPLVWLILAAAAAVLLS